MYREINASNALEPQITERCIYVKGFDVDHCLSSSLYFHCITSGKVSDYADIKYKGVMDMDISAALKEIRKNKHLLTTQQMRTLKGQVISGDIDGAMRGLDKLMNRIAIGGDK